MIYLDNQATTACDPRVLAAMRPFFEAEYGNPHSAGHEPGRRAADAVAQARAEVAALLGADPREIVFTSGATEANNLAIKGVARHAARHGDGGAGDPRRRIVTVATEHPCVLESALAMRAEGFDVVLLPVGRDGRLDLGALDAALAAAPTLLVSVMAAHNETGVLQDLDAVSDRVRAAGGLLHTDAAQAAGKIPLEAMGKKVDLVSISGHKMYGPKGVGALRVRRRPRVRLEPLFSGGGQERGLRSGTLPTPLVVGLGAACRIAAAEMAAEQARIAALRDRLFGRLWAAIPGLAVNGSMAHRLAGNLNLRFPGDVRGENLLAACAGLAASTGSACASAAIAPSPTLLAMGLAPAEAAASLRLSVGRFTSAPEIDGAAALLLAAWIALAVSSAAPATIGAEAACLP